MSFKRYHRIGAVVAALVLVGSLTATGATRAPVTRAATLHASSAAATSTPMLRAEQSRPTSAPPGSSTTAGEHPSPPTAAGESS